MQPSAGRAASAVDAVQRLAGRCVLASACFLVSPVAMAQGPGTLVADHLVVSGKQIPLPRGTWLLAGLGTQAFADPTIGAFGSIENAILFRLDGERVIAVAEINTNAVAVDDGWGRSSSCEPGPQFLLLTRYRTGWDTACLFVQPTYAPLSGPGPNAWRDAVGLAEGRRLALPLLWLSVGFRISDRQDLVDVRYHFEPRQLVDALAAARGGRRGWTPEQVLADPAKLAAVQMLFSWALGADEWLERGLRGQPAGQVPDMPGRAVFFSNVPHVDAKLLALERLHDAGALPDKDYREQQRSALAEEPVLPLNDTALVDAIQKNFSYRFLSHLGASGLGLPSSVAAASGWATLPAALAQSTLFVVNDWAWERFADRDLERDPDRVVDFTHIGLPD